MKDLNRLVVFLGVVLISGCATNSSISGVVAPGQKSVYNDGKQTIVSAKKNTVVITPESKVVTNGKRGNFVVAVKNGGARDILFSPGDISATYKDNITGKVVVLNVYNYDTLVQEEKKRQNWAAVAGALQGVSDSMNASNAGYSNTYGSYSSSAYNNRGTRAYGSGSYSSRTYNAGAAYAAQSDARARSNQRMNSLQRTGKMNLSHLRSTILKKQTVTPNAWHGGVVKMDLPNISESNQVITVLINAGGEKHKFEFSQTKEKP